MTRPLLTSLVLAALVLAVAGCGGDGGGADKLSKAQLAKRANAICGGYQDKVAALKRPAGLDAAGATGYLTKVRAIVKDLSARLGTLRPADSVKADWSALLAKFAAVAPILDDLSARVRASDSAGVTAAVGRFRALQSASATLGKRLGADSCASPG